MLHLLAVVDDDVIQWWRVVVGGSGAEHVKKGMRDKRIYMYILFYVLTRLSHGNIPG
ncbi:hypothetical protein Hanom_Chr01g00006261 [Helianthus anomalus]